LTIRIEKHIITLQGTDFNSRSNLFSMEKKKKKKFLLNL